MYNVAAVLAAPFRGEYSRLHLVWKALEYHEDNHGSSMWSIRSTRGTCISSTLPTLVWHTGPTGISRALCPFHEQLLIVGRTMLESSFAHVFT